MQNEIKIGCYVLRLPIKYLTQDAKKEDREIYESYKSKIEKIVEDGKGCLILPAVTDQDGNHLFDLKYVGQ